MANECSLRESSQEQGQMRVKASPALKSFLAIRSPAWLWFFINGFVASRFVSLPPPVFFSSSLNKCLFEPRSGFPRSHQPHRPYNNLRKARLTCAQLGSNRLFSLGSLGHVNSDSSASSLASLLGLAGRDWRMSSSLPLHRLAAAAVSQFPSLRFRSQHDSKHIKFASRLQ